MSDHPAPRGYAHVIRGMDEHARLAATAVLGPAEVPVTIGGDSPPA